MTLAGDLSNLPGILTLATDQRQTAGEELDGIMRDLDSTGAAWVAAGYRFEGPEFEAREAVFARLKTWNAARS